jgi:hypothetical protein
MEYIPGESNAQKSIYKQTRAKASNSKKEIRLGKSLPTIYKLRQAFRKLLFSILVL